MNTKMYVGNLSFDATEADVRELFEQHGTVTEVAMVMDRDTGRPRGFGFVTMADQAGMESAIKALNGQEMNGRELTVNEARPREDRPSGGRGFGGGGGGGGRGHGGGGRDGGRGGRGDRDGGRGGRY